MSDWVSRIDDELDVLQERIRDLRGTPCANCQHSYANHLGRPSSEFFTLHCTGRRCRCTRFVDAPEMLALAGVSIPVGTDSETETQ